MSGREGPLITEYVTSIESSLSELSELLSSLPQQQPERRRHLIKSAQTSLQSTTESITALELFSKNLPLNSRAPTQATARMFKEKLAAIKAEIR
jgi:hypothetical protein